jgi:translation initiation factor 1
MDDLSVKEMKGRSRKNLSGIVYSTNPDYRYATDEAPRQETLPDGKQMLRISLSSRNRGGKTVTLIAGFAGKKEELEALGKLLRVKCGTGGSVKEGEIIIQGDLRVKVAEVLRKEGYRVK